MKIHYGVQMCGQGHLNRSAEMIRRLRERGHRVFVSASGEVPPPYASKILGDFDFYPAPYFYLQDGRLNLLRTAVVLSRSMPSRVLSILLLVRRMIRNRVDLVLSDFDPLSAWASGLAGIPAAGIAGQYRMTGTDLESPDAPFDRFLTLSLIKASSLGLNQYFAVSFCKAKSTRVDTQVVGPILDNSFRSEAPREEDFFLAYLYSYTKEKILQTFSSIPAEFRIYGLGTREKHKKIQLCKTDRKSFVHDLTRCRGVILNGSFQAACEAAALGKPILSIPFTRQFEERFNAFHIERSGLGKTAEYLNSESIHSFIREKFSKKNRTLPDGSIQVLKALSL